MKIEIMNDSQPIEERLENAAKAIKDDIRGLFKSHPNYRNYLYELMIDAIKEITNAHKI